MDTSERRGKHMAEITPDEQGLFTVPDELDATADLSEAVVVPDVPKYLIPDKTYDVLKWVGLIACPAVATFVSVVGPKWGMPNVDAVVTTINATGLLIGALIGASHISAMGR
jgi:hypothetical protein